MARFETLPLYGITYRFLIDVYQFTAKMPREYKFSLGQKLQEDTLKLFTHIYHANIVTNKTEYFNSFLEAFELIRIQMRMCHDLRIMTIRQQAHFIQAMEEIGRQVGAWKKYHLSKVKKDGVDEAGGGAVL
ncbi:MAG: four helix bundle protein [Alphaproteobacteria bacterium]|nr:four helix bundle protein [Alphaproteobacteria bacterium]